MGGGRMKCPECRHRMTKVDKKAYYCDSCRLSISSGVERPPAVGVLRLGPCPYCGAPAEMYVRDEPRRYMVCCTDRHCAHDHSSQVFMANRKGKGEMFLGYRIYISRRMGKVVRKWNRDSRRPELRKKPEESPEDRLRRRSWRKLE